MLAHAVVVVVDLPRLPLTDELLDEGSLDAAFQLRLREEKKKAAPQKTKTYDDRSTHQ